MTIREKRDWARERRRSARGRDDERAANVTTKEKKKEERPLWVVRPWVMPWVVLPGGASGPTEP